MLRRPAVAATVDDGDDDNYYVTLYLYFSRFEYFPILLQAHDTLLKWRNYTAPNYTQNTLHKDA